MLVFKSVKGKMQNYLKERKNKNVVKITLLLSDKFGKKINSV